MEQLGEKRAARIAYSQKTLEIRMPLPKDEREKSFIGDVVKILLEELEIDCQYFGSTTFKRQEMGYRWLISVDGVLGGTTPTRFVRIQVNRGEYRSADNLCIPTEVLRHSGA